MISFTAQRSMELQDQRQTGAHYGEHFRDRVTRRNGYHNRDWDTQLIWTSQAAGGIYFPAFRGPRGKGERALALAR